MQRGLVFNIQRYSLHDGPGIRTTVFLKGCPLCCSWCHNPEGLAPARELLVVEGRCAVCGECRKACPFAAQLPSNGVLPTRHEPCLLCGRCVEACPTGARQMVGREMTVAEVLEEVLKDFVFYEESSGGVTLSGGEPLMQPAFAMELLEACRARGLRTAVDTCGFGCTDHFLGLARLADLVLYDLKFMDDARHREHCGVSNRPILENLAALDRIHRSIWVRVPVIPSMNDDEENLSAIARFVSTLSGVRQVNLLPYHRTGAQKHRRLGQPYALADVEPPTAAQMQRALEAFLAAGLDARAGG
ncbi:MAG: glycyl-radical enzyme activating protein [Verrucomicrobia bacterium]|nr:glycyl-radical enzyme activating protein [Verrucomicrobiota bacterium]